MQQPFIHIQNLTLQYQQKVVLQDLCWGINYGENWLLTGISGSGKTSLAKAMVGLQNAIGDIKINFNPQSKLPAKALYVASWYQFKNLEGAANFYYQQRYTSQQAKEIITVNSELINYGKENDLELNDVENLLITFEFSSLKNAQLIELSSGEHKKLQLIKGLWLRPQLLIIDQPYTGLDAASRKKLNILLDIACAEGVQLILIGNGIDWPKSINRFAQIKKGKLIEVDVLSLSLASHLKPLAKLPDFLNQSPFYTSNSVAKMENVNISYGDKQVLKNINWEIKAGEKWLLQGSNGSGKSTLLSLINADHPQSYANTLYLFGNKRGSGESIWDIKQRIGLISPEFHWYFDTSATVWQSIASGFYDTVGLFQQLPYSKSKQVDEVVAYFDLNEVKNQLLSTLPLGKQRLVLLARTIIKNPELLILDEPCQGLDNHQTHYFNQFIDELSANGMTIIYVGHTESALPNCLEKRILLENGKVKNIEQIIKNNTLIHDCLTVVEEF